MVQYLVRFVAVAAKLPGPDPAGVPVDDGADVDVPRPAAWGVAVAYELLLGIPDDVDNFLLNSSQIFLFKF